MSQVKLSAESRKRLETMVATNDGFEIAEVDLKLRGPGDIEGTMQSGAPIDLKLASLSTDSQLLQYARNVALDILKNDPLLTKPENSILTKRLNEINQIKNDLSQIS